MKTDTPITDRYVKRPGVYAPDVEVVPANLARHIEREANVLRKRLHHSIQLFGKMTVAYRKLRQEMPSELRKEIAKEVFDAEGESVVVGKHMIRVPNIAIDKTHEISRKKK